MALSEAEKEIVKQKVKNRRREMLGASLDESLSSNLNQTIQHDPNIVIEGTPVSADKCPAIESTQINIFWFSNHILKSTKLPLKTFLTEEIVQTLELIVTFVSLYGIIFYLLMTADNKKHFQKQK